MGLKTVDLKAGPEFTLTGGISLAFAEDGVTIPNGIHMVCTVDTDFTTRRQLTAKVRQPTLDPKTGQFSKDKKSISVSVPFTDGSGKVTYQTLRIEREIHPMYDTASAATLNGIGAQLLVLPAMETFWGVGTFS